MVSRVHIFENLLPNGVLIIIIKQANYEAHNFSTGDHFSDKQTIESFSRPPVRFIFQFSPAPLPSRR